MAGQETGTAAPGNVSASKRPALLAAGLLAGGGLIEIVHARATIGPDPYVVVNGTGIYRVDITGWAWSHLITGVATAIAALMVVANQRWSAPVGIAAAGLGIAIEIVTFPYNPPRAILVAGLNTAAVWLLVRHRWRSKPR